MSSSNIASFETMLIGYTDAAARFDEAAKKMRDPQATFIAAFEALNWAVALDDRVRRQWKPDGQLLSWKWRERVGHGAEIMGGVRFVRNSVHHQWADAFRVDNAGRMYPKTYPVAYFEWVWRPADELPVPDQKPWKEDEDVYRLHMEGRPVRAALNVLNGAFYWLGHLLEPDTLRKNRKAEDVPFPAVAPLSTTGDAGG